MHPPADSNPSPSPSNTPGLCAVATHPLLICQVPCTPCLQFTHPAPFRSNDTSRSLQPAYSTFSTQNVLFDPHPRNTTTPCHTVLMLTVSRRLHPARVRARSSRRLTFLQHLLPFRCSRLTMTVAPPCATGSSCAHDRLCKNSQNFLHPPVYSNTSF